MQAVILAAGNSTRTYPLTLTKPKPLLKAANKTLLEHNLDNLTNAISSTNLVDEIIVVVGYKKELIKKYIGNSYKNLKIKYVHQKRQSGTGNALLEAEKLINGDFISFYGDDIYSQDDFSKILINKYSILVKEVENPGSFGVIVEKNGIILNLVEKPRKFISDIANTGLYNLDNKIFPIIKRLKKSKRNEYELTDAIASLAKNLDIHCIEAKSWIPIGYPWDLLKADRILRGNENIIGSESKIYGNVENSSIGDGCTICGSVRNSIIMDNSFVGKESVVEDSVIGENAHFEGSIFAKNNSYSIVNGKRINAGRLGAIIADNATAKNVIINSGCKIWPNKKISNKTIKEDVK